LNNPVNFTYTICDINADNQEPFNYATTIGPLITTQTGVVFEAYNTYNEAFTGTGTVLNTIKSGIYTIFIRLEIPNGCFAVATVNMNVTFTKIVANDKKEYICFNGTDDITVNLTTLSSGMLVSPSSVPVTEFYATAANANAGINPISPTQTITTDGNFVTQTYFVRFENSDDCFTVRPLAVNLVNPVIVQSAFTICDFNNDNSEIVQLSQFSPAIIGNQNATTVFYQTSSDAIAGTNPITNSTVNGTQQVFVKITSYNCQQIYPVNLSLTSTPSVNPEVNITLNNICDNNNDSSENYNLTQAQPQIYSGSNVSFTYYLNYNPTTHVFSNQIANPAQFPVSAGSATVYVKVKFNNGECFSVSKLNIQIVFLPPVVLNPAVLETCDEEFNLNETFLLSNAVSQLFIASQNTYPLSAMTITYYNTSAEANAGNPANQIGPSITTDVSSVQVWARFQSQTTGCFSVAPIQLKTYFPPKAINSTVTVCDGNLDGSYEVNLLNFTNLMVDIPDPANSFSFYLTQQDATNGTNAIANPDNFTANPFPAQVWVKVQNIPGCDDIAIVNFTLGSKVVLQNAGPFQISVCDIGNNGTENVDLTQFQNQIYTGANVTFTYYPSLVDLNAGTSAIATPSSFNYTQAPGSNIIYVKVSVPGSCPDVVQINLSLKPTPIFDIPTLYFCPEGSLDYTVNIEGQTIINYVWTDPSGQVISTTDTITGVTVVGNYSLTVTAENGCTYTDTFEVKHFDVPVIEKLEFNGNTAVVYATGLQTILYSIDGITWQSGNTFYNLPTGITTFYVKYVNSDCIVKQQGVVLDIKNAITPNGDGLNDHWIVKNLHVFGDRRSTVKIFDRYSVLVFEQSSNTQFFWDGTISGRAIPTSSYWYVITLPDSRTFTGWILVKNNN
jgi:gliding motility-associated-like protein